MTHPYRVNPTQSDDEDVEAEDEVLPEDEEAVDDEDIHEDVLEETNFFSYGQSSLTQPAITERYDHPGHFTSLNLNAMRPDRSFLQGGPDEDPTNEFELIPALELEFCKVPLRPILATRHHIERYGLQNKG
ncbi:hypothetical protein PIB30_112677 [Stylosanthes scabra]|uniref:Uncharacterized protein n=1 Tax=Stylosanthes scabra TaxID=79078 RepID=A0ABU6Z027_9FABA|nr:hypothetical protein [Stylosanthes scabra]